MLNWQDVQDSFDLSGFNLVIHEAVHKLDMRNGGVATGVPPIPLREVAAWGTICTPRWKACRTR